MSAGNKALEMLTSRRYRAVAWLNVISVLVIIFAGFMAIATTPPLVFRDYYPPEAPVRQHPEVAIISWVAIALSIAGFVWSRRIIKAEMGKMRKLLKGVSIEKLLDLANDRKLRSPLLQAVSMTETDHYRALVARAAVWNWEDGALTVFHSLSGKIEEIKLIWPIQNKRVDGIPAVLKWASFSPFVIAVVLGGFMTTSPSLMLNNTLTQVVLWLAASGVILPTLIAMIPISQEEKRQTETPYFKRFSNQEVAWLGAIWGDSAGRELLRRARDGDGTAKAYYKLVTKRRSQ